MGVASTSGSTGMDPTTDLATEPHGAAVQAASVGWGTVDAVLGAIADLQARDLFRPVEVVSSSAVAASGLHRALLDRMAEVGQPGMVGVRSTTVNGVARRLLMEASADPTARLATRLEIGIAVRNELADNPGHFGEVATHRTTIERMVAYFQELAGLPAPDFDALYGAADGLQADAIRVVVGALGRLQSVWTESAAVEVVAERLSDHAQTLDVGLVLVNPDPFRPFEARMVEALVRRDEVVVVVTHTADRDGDEHFGLRLGRLRGDTGESREPGRVVEASNSAGPVLVEVPAPDDEVRAALRHLSALAATGVPLSEMALLYSSADPYADIIETQLSLAALPWSGPGHRPLAASVAGRVLLHCIGLASSGVDRAGLLSLVATAPVLDEHARPVPAVVWDQLTRQAGVIEPDQWGPRLDELRQALQHQATSQTGPSGAEVDRAGVSGDGSDPGSAIDHIERIQTFVQELEDLLAWPPTLSWQAWARWAERLVQRYTQPGLDGEQWPDAEVRARDRVLGILSEMSTLDQPASSPTAGPTLATVEATLDLELSGLTMPGRPTGTGLFVCDITSAAGLPFEAVAVVGLAEGRFPRIPQENPLLPRRLRARSPRYLPDERQVTVGDTRSLALVAAAGRLGTSFYASRGDMRSSRTREAPVQAQALAGSTKIIESHFRGLLNDGRPASLADFELRSLIAHYQAGIPIEVHGLTAMDETLSRGVSRYRDLQANRIGPFTGLVRPALLDINHHVFSPTALETYATCPRRYLLARVLRLNDERRPERISSIEPLERGSLVHRILERFVAEAIADDDIPAPDEAWPRHRHGRLLDLIDEEVKLARSRGVTGGEVHTEILRLELIREMTRFIARDNQFRATHRSRPVGTEFAFGFQDKPLTVSMADGRSLSLRGSVDRVDVTDDDGLVVIDYKGGKGDQFKNLEDNPLDAGRRLQLPLYARALAANQARSGTRTGVYWLTAMDEVLEMELGDVDGELQAVVGTALDGIEQGMFPAVPGQSETWPKPTHSNCRYCEFDDLCPTDRRREWELVRQDPAISLIERLRKDGELPEGDHE